MYRIFLVATVLMGAWQPVGAAEPAEGPSKPPAAAVPAAPAPKEADTKTETVPPGAAPAPPAGQRKLRFQFRFQPWKDVLDWFAQQADLSLVADAPPPGTFNFSDDREYTAAEGIDLLNGVLLTKGYTLVRRGRMLMLINLEDGIPPNLVSTITPEALETKGEYELVSVLFNLDRLKPEEAEVEIKRLLGPQGSVVPLAKSRQILVTETAGRLRAIRSVLLRIEDPQGQSTSRVQIMELKFARAEEVVPILRQLLDVPEDKPAAADGSIRIAQEAGTNRLLVSGRPEKVTRVAEVLKFLDAPQSGASGASRIETAPQLEVYSVTGSDPQSALAVLQTLLAGQPDVRLSVDAKTNSLVALARPAQQATIRATLSQLQREAQRVEVIRLNRVDPQVAVLSINRLFSAGIDLSKGGSGVAPPQVDADPTTRQLLIRGTESQIQQIRSLLDKMGESSEAGAAGQGNVRMVPLTGQAARHALEHMQEIWPGLRPNKIRVLSPGTEIPGVRPTQPEKPPAAPAAEPAKPEAAPAKEHSTQLPGGARVMFIACGAGVSPASAAETAAQQGRGVDVGRAPNADSPRPGPLPKGEGDKPADIIVVPGPDGITIASDDKEALDEFERLLGALADRGAAGRPELTVFYLKHAKASQVAELLDQVFGGGTTVVQNPAAPGMPPNVQRPAAPPREPLAMPNSLLRLGIDRTLVPTGTIRITADNRLNALVVQANAVDVVTIEQLLKVLDQKESPEDVLVAPKPRMIPVVHTQAQEVADIVRQVYADRMIEGTTPMRGGMGRMGMMGGPYMQMMQGLYGMQQQQQRGGRRNNEELPRMSVGVDVRTNALIVAAPDPLFQEVKQLVEQLDAAASAQGQTMRVVTLHRASPEAVQQALSAIAGESVQFGARPGAGQPGAQAMTSQPGMTPGQQPGLGRTRTGMRRPGMSGMQRPQWQGGFPGQTPGAQTPGSPFAPRPAGQ